MLKIQTKRTILNTFDVAIGDGSKHISISLEVPFVVYMPSDQELIQAIFNRIKYIRYSNEKLIMNLYNGDMVTVDIPEINLRTVWNIFNEDGLAVIRDRVKIYRVMCIMLHYTEA